MTTTAEHGSDRGLFQLARGAAATFVELVRNTARLASHEGRIVARKAALRIGLVAASAVVAGLGLLVALAALSFLLLGLWGVVGLGALLCAGGVAGLFAGLRQLKQPDLGFPGTVAELEADVAALRRAPPVRIPEGL